MDHTLSTVHSTHIKETGVSCNMTEEQEKNMTDNVVDFNVKYTHKYTAGQKAHGGDMWTMGAYQALENMEEEILDQWSYARQIRKTLDEMSVTLCTTREKHQGAEIFKILNRRKED